VEDQERTIRRTAPIEQRVDAIRAAFDERGMHATEGVAESHPTPAPSSRRADDADLELFHQWLEGLKK